MSLELSPMVTVNKYKKIVHGAEDFVHTVSFVHRLPLVLYLVANVVLRMDAVSHPWPKSVFKMEHQS